MPNIDSLSIVFSSKGTETAVKNIKAMGYAVRNLSRTLKTIDGSKVETFAKSMETLKKSVPTSNQTDRMVAFVNAVKDLSSVIGTANISSFSNDMSNLGQAVQLFKKSSVNSITNAVNAMQNLGTQAQKTATTISNASTPKSQKVTMGNNRGTLDQNKATIESLEQIRIKAVGVTGALEKMGALKPTRAFKSFAENAEKVRQKYEELKASLQKGLQEGKIDIGGEDFKKKSAELDALRNKYNDLVLKQRELAQEGGAFQFNPTLMKAISAFKSGFSSVTNIVRNGLLAALKSVNSHIKSFNSRIKQAGKSFKDMITGGNSATKVAKKFANELLRVSKMLKLMLVRKALRAVIAEVSNGFQSLAIHSDEFNNAMSSLINGSKTLGYSFAALVSPLINALAPALVYVINLLIKLANIFNQVISAITGATTWNKAKNFTDSWRDSITGAGDAASKTAKELKKTVLGFDELNQLQDNKDSSSGGGGGIADMFETLPIDQKWKDIADWLKKMWEIGDFYELGKKLGEKLRDWLESIPWDKIRETANKLGGALATLINGFVEVERLGYDIGYTIAQSVNTVFEFLNGFVHKLHWDSIGKFIADTFNGFFENIDWALIKDTVVTGMAGLAEAIQTFIEEFHWDNISNFIINTVDTIASGILAFIDGIDWLDFGKKIGEQIKKSIEGIDWKQVGEAIGAVIQAAVDWVKGMLDTMPSVESLIQAATDLMHGLFDRVSFEEMGENLGKILSRIVEFLKGFWEENGDEIKSKVAEFFKGIWDNIDKEELGKILGGILGIAVGFGIGKASWDVLKIALTAKIKSMVTGAAGSEVVGGAATAGGTSIGTLLLGGISAVFTTAAIVATLKMAIDDAKSYKESLGVDSLWQALFSPDEEIKAAKREYAEAKSSNPYLNGTVSAGVQDVANSWTKMQQENQLARQQDGQDVANWANDAIAKFKEWQTSNAQAREADKTSVGNWATETAQKFKEWQENNAKEFEANKKTIGDWADETSKKFKEWKENNAKEREADRESVYQWADETSKKIHDFAKDISDAMSEDKWTFSGVPDGLESTFKDAIKGVAGLWNDFVDSVNGDHSFLGKPFNINLPKINGYAMGGFPEDGLFMANHSELVGTFSNGKTAVANNAQIVEGIQKGVYSAVSSAMAQNNSSSRYIANEIVVDGEVIARTITKAQDRQDRRYSPSMG